MKFLTAVLFSLNALVAFAQPVAPATFLPFDGSAAIEMVRTGMTTQTIRLHDRTQAPSSYKVGMVLALVNSNVTEDARKFEEQMAAEAYKYVELTKLDVKPFTALAPADQAELRRFYSQERIDQAKGTVTVVGMKYRTQR